MRADLPCSNSSQEQQDCPVRLDTMTGIQGQRSDGFHEQGKTKLIVYTSLAACTQLNF